MQLPSRLARRTSARMAAVDIRLLKGLGLVSIVDEFVENMRCGVLMGKEESCWAISTSEVSIFLSSPQGTLALMKLYRVELNFIMVT